MKQARKETVMKATSLKIEISMMKIWVKARRASQARSQARRASTARKILIYELIVLQPAATTRGLTTIPWTRRNTGSMNDQHFNSRNTDLPTL